MDLIELGRVGAPYGIRCFVHVESHTDPPEGLLRYRRWLLRRPTGTRVEHELAEGKVHGAGLIARLQGIEDRDMAAALTGAVVEVERAELPPTGDREYYRADLLGFAVRNLEGAALGQVLHFLDAPAGPVMVVRDAAGHDRWVLAVPRHLRRVDIAGREILVDWPAEL